jgi:hypothetical protein
MRETPPTHITSVPSATRPCRRKVLINSPSPQTTISGKRLNYLPDGTSGSDVVQSANNSSFSMEIPRCWTRSSKCNIKARGMRSRRIPGIELAAVEPAEHGVPPAQSFRGILRLNHPVGELAEFLSAQHAIGIQPIGELNHFRLFCRRQMSNLRDDFGCTHGTEVKPRRRGGAIICCNPSPWRCDAPEIGLERGKS